MGCFSACFRLSKKRNRRRLVNSNFPGQHRLGSYEPLQSPALANKFETPGQSICSESNNQSKAKVRTSLKIRKKVSFNLNVVSYEPEPDNEIECHLLENYGHGKGKRKLENTRQSSLASKGDSTKSVLGSYPSNYRYRNCYQDEDEILYADSDDYDYSDDEVEDFYDAADDNEDDDDGPKETFDRASLKEVDKRCANKLDPCHPSSISEAAAVESNRNVRGRSQYAHPVLNPIENVSQWKVVKAKTSQAKHQRKENMTPEKEQVVPFIPKLGFDISASKFSENFNQKNPVAQDVAVDASFSHWLPPARVP